MSEEGIGQDGLMVPNRKKVSTMATWVQNEGFERIQIRAESAIIPYKNHQVSDQNRLESPMQSTRDPPRID